MTAHSFELVEKVHDALHTLRLARLLLEFLEPLALLAGFALFGCLILVLTLALGLLRGLLLFVFRDEVVAHWIFGVDVRSI